MPKLVEHAACCQPTTPTNHRPSARPPTSGKTQGPIFFFPPPHHHHRARGSPSHCQPLPSNSPPRRHSWPSQQPQGTGSEREPSCSRTTRRGSQRHPWRTGSPPPTGRERSIPREQVRRPGHSGPMRVRDQQRSSFHYAVGVTEQTGPRQPEEPRSAGRRRIKPTAGTAPEIMLTCGGMYGNPFFRSCAYWSFERGRAGHRPGGSIPSRCPRRRIALALGASVGERILLGAAGCAPRDAASKGGFLRGCPEQVVHT